MFQKHRKTNKLVYALMFVLLFAGGYLLGGYYMKKSLDFEAEGNTKLNAQDETAEYDSQQPVSINEKEKIINTSTKLKFINKYDKCGHQVVEESPCDNYLINLDEEGFRKIYNSWNIVEFSSKEVVLEKNFEQYCPNHYLVIEKEGSVVVQQNILGTEEMETINQLDVSIDYLPSDLRTRLKEGIILDTKKELLHMLENLES
ncbi:MAG: BofC C-terminal domain-containing protein [Clostridia bacterium]|nr:BofC C-terminal domain-containing protein [Clostridia bacterium]